MSFLLYAATVCAVLFLAHRFVRPLPPAAALVLAVLPLALTGGALLRGAVYGPIDHLYLYDPLAQVANQHGIGGARNAAATDVVAEFFPWRAAVRESLRRGEWPLWNGYNLCGHPLAAEAQSAPYSPFTLLACLLPAAQSMTYTAAIALFLAALSAFLLARELGRSDAASLCAAIGWGLAASIVLYSQTAMGLSTALAPLLIAATRRVVHHPGVAAGAFLTVALTLTVLAGHPESLLLNVLVASAFGILEVIRLRRAQAIAVAVAAGVVALLLCAIFLLPLLEALPQSFEYSLKGGARWSLAGSGAEVMAALATNFFPHLHVRGWLVPSLGLIPAETAAVGSLFVALAILALLGRRSPERWFFAGVAVVGIALGTRWAPLVRAIRTLPLLRITHTERLVFAAALAMVMLAAYAFDDLLRERLYKRTAGTFLAVLTVLAAGTLWISRAIQLAPPSYGKMRVAAELGGLALAVALVLLRPRVTILAPALLALLFAQRAISELDTFDTYPRSAAWPPIALLEPLHAVHEPFRAVGRGTSFPPAMNTFYGFDDPRGYEALTFQPFFYSEPLWCRREGVYFHRVDDLSRPFLSFLNIRFAMQPQNESVPAGWHALRTSEGMTLLENEQVLDRVFVPAQVALTSMNDEQLVDRMQGTTDFRSIAWIAASSMNGVRANGPGTITLHRFSHGGDYAFDADMKAGGWVVVSENAWKGWRAFIDGREAPVDRANASFLGIHVPAGHHAVRLRYRPRSFVAGAWISFATLLVLAAWAAWRRLATVRLAHMDR